MYQAVHKTFWKILFVAPVNFFQKIVLWNRTHDDLDIILNDEHIKTWKVDCESCEKSVELKKLVDTA